MRRQATNAHLKKAREGDRMRFNNVRAVVDRVDHPAPGCRTVYLCTEHNQVLVYNLSEDDIDGEVVDYLEVEEADNVIPSWEHRRWNRPGRHVASTGLPFELTEEDVERLVDAADAAAVGGAMGIEWDVAYLAEYERIRAERVGSELSVEALSAAHLRREMMRLHEENAVLRERIQRDYMVALTAPSKASDGNKPAKEVAALHNLDRPYTPARHRGAPGWDPFGGDE